MSHLEKIEIFNEYAKSQGYADWEAIIFEFEINLANTDELNLHIFAACDLVQEEQQKRIAENARLDFHDGYWKTNKQLKYFQSGADNLTVDKDSIINPENKIQ